MEPTSDARTGPEPAPASFAEFYAARHAGTVRQVALMVGSVAAAEDLVHDAFIEMYHRWDRISNPGGYLYRCVSRAAIRHLERGNRFTGEVHDGPAPVPSIEFVEVADALGRLTHQQRVAVVLRYYADLTEAQMADALGRQPGSIGPLLSRARAVLREELRG
ncbi:MAG: sigma factor [Acidimicrobiales bacterium]